MQRLVGPAEATPLITIYYWRHGFVLLAPSFVLDRRQNPYRRLAATVMYARDNPITLETGKADCVVTHAALIAPKVPRRRIVAVKSTILICDLSVATPEFNALTPLLGEQPVHQVDRAAFAPLQAHIDRLHAGALPPDELKPFIHEMVFAISGQRPRAPALHPGVAQALRLIDEFPMRAVTLPWLSKRVGLSASRLRHLFPEQVGSTLSHYLRWTAIWKGVWMWSRGTPLADVVEQVGFYDLAHANHAFNEAFGLNPSYMFNPSQVRVFKCAWG